MEDCLKFYINGEWVDPSSSETLDVINPATEEPIAKIAMGTAGDIDKAVMAARGAFDSFSRTTKAERLELFGAIMAEYTKRVDDIAETISLEMGAPMWLSKAAQATLGQAHLATAMGILENYEFEDQREGYYLRKEPIGVCGFITPWNWPINQIACKVAPALAAGCTMVLKPSEVAPMNAVIFAEILDKAGVPAGVFNLVNGDGATAGASLSAHPEVDMMSFTGSTRAGVLVAKAAADTVKRVAQELGGESPNIVLEDADINVAVSSGVQSMMTNSGQSCNAPSRMFVPAAKHDEALEVAAGAIARVVPGDPFGEGMMMGPVVSEVQFDKIQGLIAKGIEEGATLVAGGLGRPEGFNKGYFVRPTIFGGVTNDMTIAQEEIFGPVLTILPYDNEEQAIEMANDTEYGLAGYVQGTDINHAMDVAARIRSGNVQINGAAANFNAPFGGYKMSGNGREWGELGFEEFLETKAVMVPAAE
jgi:aldehyde dehydrogenase (NAD+)